MTETKLGAGSVVHMTGRGAEQWTVNRVAGDRAHITSRDSGKTLIAPLSDLTPAAFEAAGPHGGSRE